jgi:hypothetical protein
MGKRHRRIRAQSATGQVAGAATEQSPGSKPIVQTGLPTLRSPESPRPGQPTVRSQPDVSSREDFHAPSSSGLAGAVLTIALRALRKPRRLTRDASSSSKPAAWEGSSDAPNAAAGSPERSPGFRVRPPRRARRRWVPWTCVGAQRYGWHVGAMWPVDVREWRPGVTYGPRRANAS